MHFIALADYLGIFIEGDYYDSDSDNNEGSDNEKIMNEYVLKNAHKFAVVGEPRSNYDTFDRVYD